MVKGISGYELGSLWDWGRLNKDKWRVSSVHPFMTDGRAASDLMLSMKCFYDTSSACRQVISMLLPQTRPSVVLTFLLPSFPPQKAREASLKCIFHMIQREYQTWVCCKLIRRENSTGCS